MCVFQPQDQVTILSQIVVMSASLPCVAVQWAIVSNNSRKKERIPQHANYNSSRIRRAAVIVYLLELQHQVQ